MIAFQIGQTLYGATRTGNVKTWRSYVTDEGAAAVLHIVSQTKLNGKEVNRRTTITEGKNLGKANETTPREQAESEAASRYRKQIDKGYTLEIPTDTSKASDNALGLPQPMLAQPHSKVRDFKFPAMFQPKLDGHRAIVTKQNGDMVMYSRRGKTIESMDHVLDFLEPQLQEGEFLDGELYIHGMRLQDIGSLIKRKQEGSEKIVYHVYDMMLPLPFKERYEFLGRRVGTLSDDPVRRLKTYFVRDMEEVTRLNDEFLAEGYEGGILRVPSYMHGRTGWVDDVEYTAGFRSRHLLKIKAFDDAEFEILSVIEGKDRDVNGVVLKVAVFTCQVKPGVTFDVLSPGTMYEKDAAWHNRASYISYPAKQLTVQFMGFTKEGKPFHPVALRLREDI